MEDHSTISQSDESGLEHNHRRLQCGDFCALNVFKIPVLLLRNIMFPREQWDDYPNGYDRIADRLLFHPECGRGDVPTPKDFHIEEMYEELEIVTKDKVKLHAYMIKSNGKAAAADCEMLDENGNKVSNEQNPVPYSATVPTIIYLHGNAGNIGYCLELVKELKRNPDLAVCNWLLVEYRGYGKSEGVQTEKGVYADAKAAYSYAESRPDLDPKQIVLMGHSLGGAVAIHIASHKRYRKKVAGLILENTFTSIPDMAVELSKYAAALPLCCYSAKFQSVHKIKRVKCPTIFLVGLDDEVVPNVMSEKLYGKCGAKVKAIARFSDVGHNNTSMSQECIPVLAKFMKNNVIHECIQLIIGSETAVTVEFEEPLTDPAASQESTSESISAPKLKTTKSQSCAKF